MSLAGWDRAFEDRARAYWTPARTEELLGGKELLVTPDRAATLLRAMGLLHRDASMPPPQVRKFFQLNHMLWLLGPPLRELMERFDELHVVDAGCGRSYLTLALAWVMENVWEHRVRLLGVDHDDKLIADCRRRAELCGLQNTLRHVVGDIDRVELPESWDGAVHVVIALHACDTATDDAIALGLRHQAELIAVAPCCQAELARGWSNLADSDVDAAFAPVWNTPHLRRELAASLTDTFRMLLLRAAGYETRAVEFVGSEHTPKNTLIRAIRRNAGDEAAAREYRRLREATGGAGIALERQLDL